MYKHSLNNKKVAGFTLIELMVTVAIVGILAAIAVPSYNNYVRKSRRTDYKLAVSRIVQAQEKFRSVNTAYTADFASAGLAFITSNTVTTAATSTVTLFGQEAGYYNIAITNPSATGYTITATATGTQTRDTGCTTVVTTVSGNSISSDKPEC